MAKVQCAHCGSVDTQSGIDEVTCLDCGNATTVTGKKIPKDVRVVAPSPAAQRIMLAPGSNDGVDPVSLQVGAVSWPAEGVDPVAVLEDPETGEVVA